ncbi:hypothetical protein COLO4_27332 [Corchorus olitorius]|uniref:Sulfotransferase domain-containing protein n=1 Tax=Corchorus olitorius TaxID=93759 RepID=A0A1R3HS34_9ROSI|nr:hypothetical protein COLO4_27332 [Corchorus olitorius]
MSTSEISQLPSTEIKEEEKLDEGYQKTYQKFDEIYPTLPKGYDWWGARFGGGQFVQYQGFWIPSLPLRGIMLIHDHFKPRPTDIILSSSPKCGTTWLRALIFAIINRNSYDFVNHPLLSSNPQDLVLFFEKYIQQGGSTSFIESLPSPRFLQSHLPFSFLPNSMAAASSSCRFVYICRDPKDAFVSMWHFMNKLRARQELPPLPIEQAFDLFCTGVSLFGPFWDHVLGYWKASLESPNKVLFLKYEHVKRNTSASVRKIAEFLDLPFSAEEENQGIVEEIVNLCSFENLSNLDVNKNVNEEKHRRHIIKNPEFFRKGQVGDWVPKPFIDKQEIVSESYQKTYKKFDEIIPTLPKDKGWWNENLAQYQGFWLPSLAVLGALLINDHFKPRPTDIILSTSPKCGTTWLRALIFAIINRNSYDFEHHPLVTTNPQDLVPFFEGYIRRNGSCSLLDSLPSPRFLSTHLPYSLFPKSMASTCRFVYICRDPKDVFVSKWHFMKKLRPKELAPISFDEAFELFSRGVSHYGPIWDHALGYWKASRESPDQNVLFLKYEDVKKETSVYVRKLAEFLGVPFSAEEEKEGIVERIVRLCSFENLSNLEVNKTAKEPRIKTRPVSNPDYFRKGQVGDWMNHLTLEMSRLLDQISKDRFQGSGLSFDLQET